MHKIINQKISDGLKLIIFIFLFIFYSNICFAAYHEVNENGNELSTSTIEQIELSFPSNDDLKNELNNEDDTTINIINYKKPYFWILIFCLLLVLFILIRLFKKLSHMDREFKVYEKRLKKSNGGQLSDKDEIVYSINETNNIKPENDNDEKTTQIKVTTEKSEENIEQKITEQLKVDIESEKSEEQIVKINNEKNSDDDYIFEE